LNPRACRDLDRFLIAGQSAVAELLEKRALAADGGEDSRLGDAGPFSDLVYGRADVALLEEERAGSLQHQAARGARGLGAARRTVWASWLHTGHLIGCFTEYLMTRF